MVRLNIITNTVEIGAHLHSSGAVEALDHLHRGTSVRKHCRTIHTDSDVISSDNVVLTGTTIPFQYAVVVSVRDTAEDIPFVSIVNAVAVRPDHHVVTIASNL